MKRRKKVLAVTGGAGFIGSHLVGALLAEKYKVIIVDNFSSGKMENLRDYRGDKNLTIIKADILNKGRLLALFKDVDWVYHLATQCLRLSIANPELVHQVNTTGTLNVYRAAQHNKVKRVIYVSSSEAYGSAKVAPMSEEHPCEPTTIYGASKLTGELYARAFLDTYGLPTVIIRPFNTYGPRSHFEGPYGEVIPKFVIRALNDRPPVIFGDGTQTRDFTYVTDVAKGIILASQSERLIGKAVNVAYGREVSINKIAALILAATGKKKLKPIRGKRRPGDVRRHYADISLAKRILKYQPKIKIEEGIRKYIDWFRNNNFNLASLLKKEKVYNW